MKKLLAVFCAGAFVSTSVFAAIPPGNDVTTKPDLYYLKNSQAIDSLALLPPPPEAVSYTHLTLPTILRV